MTCSYSSHCSYALLVWYSHHDESCCDTLPIAAHQCRWQGKESDKTTHQDNCRVQRNTQPRVPISNELRDQLPLDAFPLLPKHTHTHAHSSLPLRSHTFLTILVHVVVSLIDERTPQLLERKTQNFPKSFPSPSPSSGIISVCLSDSFKVCVVC